MRQGFASQLQLSAQGIISIFRPECTSDQSHDMMTMMLAGDGFRIGDVLSQLMKGGCMQIFLHPADSLMFEV